MHKCWFSLSHHCYYTVFPQHEKGHIMGSCIHAVAGLLIAGLLPALDNYTKIISACVEKNKLANQEHIRTEHTNMLTATNKLMFCQISTQKHVYNLASILHICGFAWNVHVYNNLPLLSKMAELSSMGSSF